VGEGSSLDPDYSGQGVHPINPLAADAWAAGVLLLEIVSGYVIEFLYKLVNKGSDTDLGNTQSAPRGGERATVC